MNESENAVKYDSAQGWEREVAGYAGNDLVCYYQIKDYWCNELVRCVRSEFDADEALKINILAFISFAEWNIFLLKLFQYIKKGVSEGIFDKDVTVGQLDFIKTPADYDDKYYKNVYLKFVNKRIEGVDSSRKIMVELEYYHNLSSFTLLDIAIALHSAAIIPPDKFVSECKSLGVTKYHKCEYDIPFIDFTPDRFTVRKFRHEDIIRNYLSHLNTKPTASFSTGHGIYNSLSGEYVRPNDDTFYIDDFR